MASQPAGSTEPALRAGNGDIGKASRQIAFQATGRYGDAPGDFAAPDRSNEKMRMHHAGTPE
jgi:hypothetical protein